MTIALGLWEESRERAAAARVPLEDERAEGTTPSLALEEYVGVYTDPLYGELEIAVGPDGLRLSWRDLPRERGPRSRSSRCGASRTSSGSRRPEGGRDRRLRR